jgi:hypothetical protein
MNWRPVLFIFIGTIPAIMAPQDSALLFALGHQGACPQIVQIGVLSNFLAGFDWNIV